MSVTPTPSFTPLPPAPSRLQDTPDEFNALADPYADAWADVGPEIQAIGEAAEANAQWAEAKAGEAEAARDTAQSVANAVLAASTYVGTSNASVSIGSGSKALTSVSGGSSIVTGDDITAFSRSNVGKRIRGPATVSGSTITLTVPGDGFAGTGTVNDWVIAPTWLVAVLQGVAADMLLGTSASVALSPDSIYDALAEVALADNPTIAVDMSTFINARVTLGGNRTLGNPTNAKPGQTGRIRVIQDPTGSRTLAFGSNWKRQGGAPTLTTTAGAFDLIVYDVITTSLIVYDIIRNPT